MPVPDSSDPVVMKIPPAPKAASATKGGAPGGSFGVIRHDPRTLSVAAEAGPAPAATPTAAAPSAAPVTASRLLIPRPTNAPLLADGAPSCRDSRSRARPAPVRRYADRGAEPFRPRASRLPPFRPG